MTVAMLPLGAPPRVHVTKVVRTMYRVEWEYDGYEIVGEGEVERRRKRKSHHTLARAVAYRQAALRLIFSYRDVLATGMQDSGYPSGCRLCEATAGGPEDYPQCRYHGGPGFEELRDRLARWLMWRDGSGR